MLRKTFRWTVVLARLATGSLLCWWAVHRWHWYTGLPRFSDPHLCGNCFLAVVGIPLECGVVGVFLLMQVLLPATPRTTRSAFVAWVCIIVGILTTAQVLGVLPFLAGSAILLVSYLGRLFRDCKSRVSARYSFAASTGTQSTFML